MLFQQKRETLKRQLEGNEMEISGTTAELDAAVETPDQNYEL